MTTHRDVTDAEREVISLFARQMRESGSNAMVLGELLALRDGTSRGEIQAALERLVSRGWVFVGSSLQWRDHQVCTLVGDGMKLAQSMTMNEGKPPAS